MGVSTDTWKKDKEFSTFRVTSVDLKYFELFMVADLKQIIEKVWDRHDFSLIKQKGRINEFSEAKKSSPKYYSPPRPLNVICIFKSEFLKELYETAD